MTFPDDKNITSYQVCLKILIGHSMQMVIS